MLHMLKTRAAQHIVKFKRSSGARSSGAADPYEDIVAQQMLEGRSTVSDVERK